jgi:hypothetical protein
VAFYLFNVAGTHGSQSRSPRQQAIELLRDGVWDVGADEPHRDALAPGDLALVYAAAPDSVFVGRAELASAVVELASTDARSDPSDLREGVLLAGIEEWDPPVPMDSVLARLDPSAKARAEFAVGCVRIIAHEYETAVAVAAERRR